MVILNVLENQGLRLKLCHGNVLTNQMENVRRAMIIHVSWGQALEIDIQNQYKILTSWF